MENNSKKILIVDDEPHIAQMIQSRLEANHYEVIKACDGEEALTKLQKQKVDLILCDVSMPRMNGYEFVRALNRMPGLRDIPVIILTATQHLDELFHQEGIEDYLTKPFKSEELCRIISQKLYS